MGLQTVEAQRGSEALKLLEDRLAATGSHGVDAILKNHDPPEGNAVRFLHRLRERPALSAIPTISESQGRSASAPYLEAVLRQVLGRPGLAGGQAPSRPSFAPCTRYESKLSAAARICTPRKRSVRHSCGLMCRPQLVNAQAALAASPPSVPPSL